MSTGASRRFVLGGASGRLATAFLADVILRASRPLTVSLVVLAQCAVWLASTASAAQLTLTWTDNATNEQGFAIDRRIGTAGGFVQIAVVGVDATSYIDGALASGTTYCYRLRAFNSSGSSGYSNEACATTSQSTMSLVVVRAGTGGGTVTSQPAGITCGVDCSETFPSGTVVTLTAAPDPGSTFAGWSGGGCAGTQPCILSGNTGTSVTATFLSGTAGCPAGQYRAEYFSGTDLVGNAVFTQCEAVIDHIWGGGGPGNGVGPDNFSVRWTGQIYFPGGNAAFTARADDGVRLWVDGTPIIDAWRDQAATTYQVTRYIPAGTHDVRVEYYERTGEAVAQVSW
jgi:hypothetical protein